MDFRELAHAQATWGMMQLALSLNRFDSAMRKFSRFCLHVYWLTFGTVYNIIYCNIYKIKFASMTHL